MNAAGRVTHDVMKQQHSSETYRYRPDIDGLRAVAILAVLVFHANSALLPGGFCGVDVFFVISGFLITRIIVQELESGQFGLRGFYARRARRLLPALSIVLPTTLVLGWLILLPNEFTQLGADVVGAAVFSSNVLLYKGVVAYFLAANRPLLHLWSLAVEEQFYLLWPALVYIAWKLGKRRIASIAAAVSVASFVANIAVVSLDSPAAFYLPWNRLWELSCGAVLAGLQQHLPGTTVTTTQRAASLSGWLRQQRLNLYSSSGAILLIVSFLRLNGKMEFPGYWGLLPTTGAALILGAGPRTWLSRHILSRPPVVFIGLVSYPLYLWHWPLLCFTRLLVPEPVPPALLAGVVLLAFLLAVITYVFVEQPVRHRRDGPAFPIAICTVLGGCALVGCLSFARYIPARSISADVERILPPRKEVWSITRNAPWTFFPKDFIEIEGAPTKTLFIGDSFMEQYLPRIERVVIDSEGQANTAVFAVRGACSLPYEFSWGFGRAACKQHIEKALAYAQRKEVATVVLASAWFGYFMTESQGRWSINPDSLPALARLRETIAGLRKLNKQVYIVLAGPMDRKLDPMARIRRTVLPPGFEVRAIPAPTKLEIQARFGGIEALLRQIASDTGAHIIDPMDALCDRTTCPALTANGEPIYLDTGHLRPSFMRASASFVDETVWPLPQTPHSVAESVSMSTCVGGYP